MVRVQELIIHCNGTQTQYDLASDKLLIYFNNQKEKFESLGHAIIVDGACRYLGETIRKNYGGYWDIDTNVADPDKKSVPFITRFEKGSDKYFPYLKQVGWHSGIVYTSNEYYYMSPCIVGKKLSGLDQRPAIPEFWQTSSHGSVLVWTSSIYFR
ncbi:MAG: hypothetical protein NVSMB67_27700 [Flavisolibacter sp.]